MTDPPRGRRHPHRLRRDGAALPRLAARICPLFAETSGKNAIIVTALADRDQAIRDLVRSAFGHNGQKCSAASLAICEAEVYDDPAFRRQLRDAAASLAVGSAWDLASRVTPLTQAPGPALRRALTVLDEGEEWLLEPRPAPDNPQLWSPGIKLGVRPGSFFHRTECFGPVLGLMRAEDLDQAIALANATPFGLTSGIETLDDREVVRWVDRLEAGNLYVNRAITGAIVGRQPFGGWKASSVGPGAKAGGPNYVLQLARWRQVAPPDASTASRCRRRLAARLERCLAAAAGRRRRAPSSRPARRATRAPGGATSARSTIPARSSASGTCSATAPAGACSCGAPPGTRWRWPSRRWRPAPPGVPLLVSLPPDSPPAAWLAEGDGVEVVVEAEAGFVERLAHPGDAERVRVSAPISTAARAAANGLGLTVLDAPVLANGRLELRWYVREQTVSRVAHRYGSVTEPAATE